MDGTDKDLTLDIKIDREDIILLLLEAHERLFGKRILSGITRLEKLIFLLEKETEFEGIARFFLFEPHNFGPFSKEVYEAVEFLDGCELIKIHEKKYTSYYASVGEAKLLLEISTDNLDEDSEEGTIDATEKQFSLTENGRIVARKIKEAISRKRPSDQEQLDQIVLRFAPLPLNQLIRYVYRRYPDMAVESKHPEAKSINSK